MSRFFRTIPRLLAAAALLTLTAANAQNDPTAPSGMGETTALTAGYASRAAAGTESVQDTEVIDGLELEVWAPPGLVANPLTLDFDSDGRAYVVASSRAGLLLDIRQHPDWVPEVHSLRSTEDLRAFFRREMAPELSDENEWLPDYNGDGSHDYRDLTVVAERIFRVDDRDGDGLADRSQVVHEGFNADIASDIAGGILFDEGTLYVTAAPDLWRLRDTTGDGLFETSESLSHGYSVHPAFSGHDMSALAIGPDGRLYWKIGDIGLNVADATGRRWEYPHTGAVLRSEIDGSDFEVFAWGLRNAQEIAFDKHGNLVSVDNDGDHAGETERVVYIVNGSDAGWRSNWQYGKFTDPKNNRYNVWMEEALYRPHFDGQAAYITPPIASHHAGPSGFAYNPGTALAPAWQDFFFVTSFTGGASNASVYAFQLEPEGAGFTLANDTRLVRGLLSSGIAFGPDGALYLTDWVRGWGATGEGQLWRLDAPASAGSALRREVAALLDTDFSAFDRRELARLIAHADMRIRQHAQFELAERDDADTLIDIVGNHADRLPRLHAIWGLGQLARRDPAQATLLLPLLADADAEVRAQTAKVLGDTRDIGVATELIAALDDEAPRVRFFATEALGRIGAAAAVEPIVAMLAANGDSDVYLRTAGIHALASIGDAAALESLAAHPSAAVRIAAVVALRRLGDVGAAAFVADADPFVATEAARAINDEGGIVPALPTLAAALDRPVETEAFVRRALSANLRVGDAGAARRTGEYAADAEHPAALRREAVELLGVWAEPSTLDRVDGAWLGQLGSRDTDAARLAARELLPLLEREATDAALKLALLESAVALEVDGTAGYALRRLENDTVPAVRIAALTALQSIGGSEAASAVGIALADDAAAVRMAAIEAMPIMPVPAAISVAELESAIASTTLSVGERQSAIATLGAIAAPQATTALERLLTRLDEGAMPEALQFDVLAAAAASGNETLLERLDALGAGRDLAGVGRRFPAALAFGGAAADGRGLVLSHPAAQCTRCHALEDGEADVGPTLEGIGTRLSRAELLEAMIEPTASLAEGFGDAAGGPSAMPPMDLLLTPRQIRDIVEFLAVAP